MTLDWDVLLAGHDGWVLVANLPYNVATPLVADLLDTVPAIDRMLVMVQREVAERLAARARPRLRRGQREGRVLGTARLVGDVPASVFVPRPNVESALVEIIRRPAPPVEPGPLFALVRAAFGQRRKMLRRSLAGVVDRRAVRRRRRRADARPEELDLDAWVRLTNDALT